VGRGLQRDGQPLSYPGLEIETLEKPQRYTDDQLDRAARIAWTLKRGKLVLCEPPRRA
jgi:hypothetical protein